MKNITEDNNVYVEENVNTAASNNLNHTVSIQCRSRQERNKVEEIATLVGINEECVYTQGNLITISNINDRQLAQLSRKFKIQKMAQGIITVSNAVQSYTTDMADFALNGALVPATGAVINASGKVVLVAGKAAISIGSAVVGSTLENSRLAYSSLKHDNNVIHAGKELKNTWRTIKSGCGKLFGSSNVSSEFIVDGVSAK